MKTPPTLFLRGETQTILKNKEQERLQTAKEFTGRIQKEESKGRKKEKLETNKKPPTFNYTCYPSFTVHPRQNPIKNLAFQQYTHKFNI